MPAAIAGGFGLVKSVLQMINSPVLFLGSCLLTVCGIIINALKVCCVQCRYFSGNVANWLDHAKENYGGHYTETQVENTKLLIRLFPLFAFQILYRSCVMQVS